MDKKFMGVIGFFMCMFLIISDARSQSVEELMAQGDGLLKNGAYSEAVTIFRKVVSKEPRNFEAQSNLAFSYLQSERYTNAVAEYNKAIGLSPRSAESWLNLGYSYEKLGKRSKAVEAIHHAVELDPGNVDARMNLAAFFEDANQFDKAAALYEQVIKIDGANRGDAYVGVARCLIEKGNVAGAKKYCLEAIASNANNAAAHWQLGTIYWKKESKPDDAIKEFKSAIAIDPNTADFYENYAMLLEELGRKDEAIATWKSYMVYLNDALKKEGIEQRIAKLERGETVVISKEDKKASREHVDQQEKANLEKLKSEMRTTGSGGPGDSRRIDAPPPDVNGDLDDINKDKGDGLDLRKEAKKKAAEDKGK
jgi:tetratricopeptide (TPR) repeat protein